MNDLEKVANCKACFIADKLKVCGMCDFKIGLVIKANDEMIFHSKQPEFIAAAQIKAKTLMRN